MKSLVLTAVLSTLGLCSPLRAQSSAATGNQVPLYVKVQLDSSVKLSSLKAGESVDGNLMRDVYSPESKVFTSGSHVRLTVSRVERRRKTPSQKWPWIARIVLPHHENSPIFSEAAVSMPDGTKSVIPASLLSSNRMKELKLPSSRNSGKNSKNAALIDANPAETASAKKSPTQHGPLLYLETYRTSVEPFESSGWIHPGSSSSILPAGTLFRVLLLEDISASKNHIGDPLHARLLEPVSSDSHVLIPAGSIFEGRVMQVTPPRIPSRPGSLAIAFDSVRMPEGRSLPVSVSLASVNVSAPSPLKMDAEGRLHGARPGAMWMLINGGAAGGLAKVADDGTQLIVEAIISTATDASTAGTARLAATIVSGAFMLTRKGHDVVLPNHTEMAITLNRPLTFSAQVAAVPSSERQIRSGN